MTSFIEIYQPELWFFPPDDLPPTKEQLAWWVSRQNPANPLRTIIGHEAAVRRLCRFAFDAFSRHNRECSDFSFALLGPQSCGKATLAQVFGELVGLPFVEIDAGSCNDINEVVVTIAKTLEEFPIVGNEKYSSLELQDLGDGKTVIPPCIVFVDQVDQLPKKVEQGLRRAIEGRIESNGWTFDSSAVCWIVSTTDYAMPDGFDRLNRIVLKLLSTEEVGKIVAFHNPDFPPEVCHFIAQHAATPRDALAFARESAVEAAMHGDLERAIGVVASDLELEKSLPWTIRLNGCNGHH